jgi:DUF2993 family protein
VTAAADEVEAGRVRRSRRPDPRTIAFAAVVLAFIGALLAGSDYLARIGSQSLIARAIQRDLHLAERPGVHVRGTFYLPQVVNGEYDDVQIDIGHAQAGPMEVESINAELNGVHLRFHDVLTRHVSRMLIDRTTELVTLSYAEIDKYLKAIGTPVSISPSRC